MRNGDEGHVRYEVAVSRRGKPTSCRVIASSGHAALGAATCPAIMKRARIAPATDPKGKPMAGTLTANVIWRLGQR